MHEKMGLTHTDLKPENILLKLDSRKQISDSTQWPIQVRRKKEIYDGEKVDESDSQEDDQQRFSEEQPETQIDGCTGGNIGGGSDLGLMPQDSAEAMRSRRRRFRQQVWIRPLDDTVKIIDFGGATYKNE